VTTSATARHRASVRPATPLSSLTTAVTGQIGVIGRGGVVVAMSSGLVATTGLPSQAAEQAAPAPESATPPLVAPAPAPVGAAFQTALLPAVSPAEASELLEAGESLTAPLAADLAFETGEFTALPAPKPKAKAAPQTRRSARAADKAAERSAVEGAVKTAVKTAAERAAKPAATRQTAAKQAATRQAAAREAAARKAAAARQAQLREAKQAAQARARQAERARAKAKAKAPSAARSKAPASTRGSSVLSVAARYVGVPYRYGGTTPIGWDCSGSVRYIYRQLGVSLPRTAHQQMMATTRISRSRAKAGDLVFFVSSGRAYHMGIYAGNGMMYDAGRSGRSFSKRAIWSDAVVFTRV
jgi:cell wall-associated NlpC family hydrolase